MGEEPGSSTPETQERSGGFLDFLSNKIGSDKIQKFFAAGHLGGQTSLRFERRLDK